MLELFAQRGAAAAAPDAGVMGILAAYIGIIIAFIAIGLIIQIFFLLNLSKTLNECSSRNRKMEPGQVWLCLIPIFGAIWMIIVISRMSESLSNEFDERGMHDGSDYGKQLGLIYIISAIVGAVCGLFGIVSLVCFIMYWIKIAGYRNQLTGGSRSGKRSKRRPVDDADDE